MNPHQKLSHRGQQHTTEDIIPSGTVSSRVFHIQNLLRLSPDRAEPLSLHHRESSRLGFGRRQSTRFGQPASRTLKTDTRANIDKHHANVGLSSSRIDYKAEHAFPSSQLRLGHTNGFRDQVVTRTLHDPADGATARHTSIPKSNYIQSSRPDLNEIDTKTFQDSPSPEVDDTSLGGSTSMDRQQSVRELYAHYGIERPSGLVSADEQPVDTEGCSNKILLHRICHVCLWTNGSRSQCWRCGHRLCKECDSLPRLSNVILDRPPCTAIQASWQHQIKPHQKTHEKIVVSPGHVHHILQATETGQPASRVGIRTRKKNAFYHDGPLQRKNTRHSLPKHVDIPEPLCLPDPMRSLSSLEDLPFLNANSIFVAKSGHKGQNSTHNTSSRVDTPTSQDRQDQKLHDPYSHIELEDPFYIECHGYPRTGHDRRGTPTSRGVVGECQHCLNDCDCRACQRTPHSVRCCVHTDHKPMIHRHLQNPAKFLSDVQENHFVSKHESPLPIWKTPGKLPNSMVPLSSEQTQDSRNSDISLLGTTSSLPWVDRPLLKLKGLRQMHQESVINSGRSQSRVSDGRTSNASARVPQPLHSPGHLPSHFFSGMIMSQAKPQRSKGGGCETSRLGVFSDSLNSQHRYSIAHEAEKEEYSQVNKGQTSDQLIIEKRLNKNDSSSTYRSQMSNKKTRYSNILNIPIHELCRTDKETLKMNFVEKVSLPVLRRNSGNNPEDYERVEKTATGLGSVRNRVNELELRQKTQLLSSNPYISRNNSSLRASGAQNRPGKIHLSANRGTGCVTSDEVSISAVSIIIYLDGRDGLVVEADLTKGS